MERCKRNIGKRILGSAKGNEARSGSISLAHDCDGLLDVRMSGKNC